MPAIQPARLKQQAALLAEHYYDPTAFARSLHHLLDFYSERSIRQGQLEKPVPLMPAYRVRPPVIRQVLSELLLRAQKDSDSALELCDILWQQPYLEFRQLAIGLLGQLPVNPPEPIIDRINSWIEEDLEFILLDAIFLKGMVRLRKENALSIMKMIDAWLKSDSPTQQAKGLRAMLIMSRDPDFDNLPALINLVEPLIRESPRSLRPDVLDILIELARLSPQETAYLLVQTLELPNSSDTPWFIRHSLKEFPENLGENLRIVLRTRVEQTRENN